MLISGPLSPVPMLYFLQIVMLLLAVPITRGGETARNVSDTLAPLLPKMQQPSRLSWKCALTVSPLCWRARVCVFIFRNRDSSAGTEELTALGRLLRRFVLPVATCCSKALRCARLMRFCGGKRPCTHQLRVHHATAKSTASSSPG